MTEHEQIQARFERSLTQKAWAVFTDQGLKTMSAVHRDLILNAINIIASTAAAQWSGERKEGGKL